MWGGGPGAVGHSGGCGRLPMGNATVPVSNRPSLWCKDGFYCHEGCKTGRPNCGISCSSHFARMSLLEKVKHPFPSTGDAFSGKMVG